MATLDTPLVPIDPILAETSRVLVISTAHVTAETGALFDNTPQWGPACMTWVHGWMVWADTDAEDWSEGAPELLHVLRSAHAAGFDWVRFDCDADAVEGLPTWEW
jgi:hypothetical protein